MSGALAEETRLRQIEASAFNAVTDAANNQRSAKKKLKQKQKSVDLGGKKRAFKDARKKFRQAKTEDEKIREGAILKNARTNFDTAKAAVAAETKAFKDAKSNLKNAQKAAKAATSAAEDAAKDVKVLQAQLNSGRALRRLKRAKRQPIEAARPQQATTKAWRRGNKHEKNCCGPALGSFKADQSRQQEGEGRRKNSSKTSKGCKQESKGSRKKSSKTSKGCKQKAKAAAKKAAKQAKAAAKKAAKQAKAARKAAARSSKAALRKARREAANN